MSTANRQSTAQTTTTTASTTTTTNPFYINDSSFQNLNSNNWQVNELCEFVFSKKLSDQNISLFCVDRASKEQ
jgi:hypothetical protein